MIEYALVLLGAYLLGSISWGLIVGKVTRGIDVRQHGSGATGTANVLRTLGPRWAVLVLAADVSKGVIAVFAAKQIIGAPMAEALAGFLAVAGHNWPVFSRFQGGRGVTVGVGGMAVMSPVTAAIALGVFISSIAASRYVSLGSVLAVSTAAVMLTILVVAGQEPWECLVYVGAGCPLILWRHAGNMRRLMHGTERRLWGGDKTSGQEPPKRET
ncbi:MAG: glycerol-3-phosphate 1-O-acyltransferase [Dehalococcoidia bacterium]|nr:glycerol-3-phosphate 1-O-acyltransferase [Dehalococcoidia bacterium]